MKSEKHKDGRFRNKSIPFTMVPNPIILDKNISLEAKGLYAIIQCHITIPQFVLYKSHLATLCSNGKYSFNSAWKQLKTAGYLRSCRENTPDGFEYTYELLDSPYTGFPCMGNPSMDSPCMDNRMLNNTVKNNTEQNKKNGNKTIINFPPDMAEIKAKLAPYICVEEARAREVNADPKEVSNAYSDLLKAINSIKDRELVRRIEQSSEGELYAFWNSIYQMMYDTSINGETAAAVDNKIGYIIAMIKNEFV